MKGKTIALAALGLGAAVYGYNQIPESPTHGMVRKISNARGDYRNLREDIQAEITTIQERLNALGKPMPSAGTVNFCLEETTPYEAFKDCLDQNPDIVFPPYTLPESSQTLDVLTAYRNQMASFEKVYSNSTYIESMLAEEVNRYLLAVAGELFQK